MRIACHWVRREHQVTDQTGKRRRRWRLPVILAAATAALTAGTLTAMAAVAPAPEVNTIGSGGYDVNTAGITASQEVLNADQYGLIVAGGRQGLKMCNSVTDETAAIGEYSANLATTYAVQHGVGVASGCPAGELDPSALITFPALSAVPFGHHVWMNETLVTKAKTVKILVCIIVGKHVRCHVVVRHYTRDFLVFEAQDLDAATVSPSATDAPGVQTAVTRVPAGTTFDHALWGTSEDTASLVGCSGNGFPAVLAGPAAYTTAACQPVDVAEYATYAVGAAVNPLPAAATLSEVISPSASGALIAPNNSLTAVNTGPHGTASDASVTGGHFALFTANAPES
jgi:hypothetical protein